MVLLPLWKVLPHPVCFLVDSLLGSPFFSTSVLIVGQDASLQLSISTFCSSQAQQGQPELEHMCSVQKEQAMRLVLTR